MISMTVLAILGSPSQTSRTAKLVDRAADILQAADIQLQRSSIHDFPAQALLHADFSSEAVKQFQQRVARAQGIIIATPVYKAAYAGALKVLLDLIPEGGLTGKPVLPLASGGSPGHLLAVDYAIKPVLAALILKPKEETGRFIPEISPEDHAWAATALPAEVFTAGRPPATARSMSPA